MSTRFDQAEHHRRQQGRAAGPAGAKLIHGEVRADAERIIAKYPHSRSAVLPLLFLVQSVEGYVTEAGMREVAEILGMTPAQVLAAASFYSMLKKEPQGEYLVSVCRNITCTHMGGRKLASAAERRLGIAVGETTADAKFTLETAECLATCDGAPAIQINYEDFYNLTPEALVGLIDKLERGEEVRSKRGEPVRTAQEISHETAVAGAHRALGAGVAARTVGGESPRADMAPGVRPKEPGDPTPPRDPADQPAAAREPKEAESSGRPEPAGEGQEHRGDEGRG